MRECLNADEILGFLAGPGSPNGLESESEVHAHLADCADCAALLAAALRTSVDTAASLASGQAQAGIRIGRYQVQELVGCGAHGAVYRCLDPALGRSVALKIQRAEEGPGQEHTPEMVERLRARLVEEARSMARLHHPNVVPIYDVDRFEGQVYLVMEFIEGLTLRRWLREHPAGSGCEEILELFSKAGRGLAAAHAVGLIHRDFKPENVLICHGGDVKVTDFGLARAAPTAARAKSTTLSVVGTPGYIAPEQLAGLTADACSDQFSFCAALYEALYGTPPDPADIALSSTWIPPAVSPKGLRVPSRLRRALRRGLSIRPEHRYPTLLALLEVLTARPARARRRQLAGAGISALALAGVGAFAGIALHAWGADPCRAPERKLAGVWDRAVRAQLSAVFSAAGTANRGAAVESALDATSAAWLAAYQDACAATREQHAQSEAALALRLDCLDDQLLDLRAAVELSLRSETEGGASILGSATLLPLPSECSDARNLTVVPELLPERRAQAEELRRRLARGRALFGAGRYAEAIEVLRPLPDAAEALEDVRLQVRALTALADAFARAFDPSSATALHQRAEAMARGAHLNQLAARAAAGAAADAASLGSPSTDADSWLQQAGHDFEQAGSSGAAGYDLEAAAGIVETLRGRDAEAVAHHRRARELAARWFGRGRGEAIVASSNLAFALERVGEIDASLGLFRGAIASEEAILRPTDPGLLTPRLGFARILLNLDRASEAEQALDGFFARAGQADRFQTALALAMQADVQAQRYQETQSTETVGRALAMAARLRPLESRTWTELHAYAAEAYLHAGQPELALDAYQRYLSAPGLPDDHPARGAFLRLGGWAYLDVGQPREALPLLERALELGHARPAYPCVEARLRYQIATALVQTGGDRRRATALAQLARDELVAARACDGLVAQIDAWTEALAAR